MAVDTRNKRANCLNVANPFKFSAPNPDGAISSQADRQHMAYAYLGILATSSAFKSAWASQCNRLISLGEPR
jgi:hypothetical protein